MLAALATQWRVEKLLDYLIWPGTSVRKAGLK